MIKPTLAIAASLAIAVGSVCTSAQTKKRPAPVKIAAIAAPEASAAPEYEIHVLILSSGLTSASVVASDKYLTKEDLPVETFFKDYFAAGAKRRYPKIIVKFDDEASVATIRKVIDEVRVSDRAVIELVSYPEDVRLSIEPKPAPNSETHVKPNPLMLLVEMTDKKALILNGGDLGSLASPQPLEQRLTQVFKDREQNGVFRENTNEIEKTVSILMPPTATGADLLKVCRAVITTGADRLVFQMDAPEVFRIDMVPDVQVAPPPGKKRTHK